MKIWTQAVKKWALDPLAASLCLCLTVAGGQTVRPTPGARQVRPAAGIEAHFAAARQALEEKDYLSAEREYRAVLAIKPDFAEVHMNLGLLYQLQDRVPDATSEFRRALRLKPTLAGANFFLGVNYCKAGDGAKAIPYLEAAIRQEPKQPEIRSWLATAQKMSGDYQAEVVTLKDALHLEPRSEDLLYLLGHAYERLGSEEARELQKVTPGSARTEQLLAESYVAGSAWSMAVLRFENALAISPTMPGLHVGMGEVLLRAGRLKRAVAEFDEELRLAPGSVRAITRRGEARLVHGDVDGALEDWTRALGTDQAQAELVLGIRESISGDAALEQLPQNLKDKVEELRPLLKGRETPAGHFALAFLAVQAGSPTAVTADPEKVLADSSGKAWEACSEENLSRSLKDGRLESVRRCAASVLNARLSSELRIRVAGALFETGDFETSLAVLSRLSRADWHSPEASYWRGRCYEKLATSAYVKLSAANPDSYRMHQLLGDLAAANDADRKAIDEYRAAISAKPTLPNLHYSLGHLLWKALKVREAREEFEAELKLDNRHAGALDELGDTYLLEHQPERALAYLMRALARDPRNPGIHRDLGTAYSQLGDHEKAAAEFRIAVADDHDGSVHYKLARTYQALGQKEKAAREFKLSTALNRESHEKLESQGVRLSSIESPEEQ